MTKEFGYICKMMNANQEAINKNKINQMKSDNLGDIKKQVNAS